MSIMCFSDLWGDGLLSPRLCPYLATLIVTHPLIVTGEVHRSRTISVRCGGLSGDCRPRPMKPHLNFTNHLQLKILPPQPPSPSLRGYTCTMFSQQQSQLHLPSLEISPNKSPAWIYIHIWAPAFWRTRTSGASMNMNTPGRQRLFSNPSTL